MHDVNVLIERDVDIVGRFARTKEGMTNPGNISVSCPSFLRSQIFNLLAAKPFTFSFLSLQFCVLGAENVIRCNYKNRLFASQFAKSAEIPIYS